MPRFYRVHKTMPAKKHNEQADTDPPVEQAKTAPISRQDRHAQLREARRALELELAAIKGQIQQAITDGDVEALNRLNARNLELPGLFIAASTSETNARHQILNAEDKINAEALESAIAERDKLEAALVKLQRETEIQIAALKGKVADANQEISALYSAIGASRNLGADNDAAFRRSLAKLAGV